MDAGALGASGISTSSLVRSTDALGSERRLLEHRGYFACHRTVSTHPVQAGQGQLPARVHSARQDHLATSTQGAPAVSRALSLPTTSPPSRFPFNDISQVARQPPVSSDLTRLVYEAPNDRPSEVGPRLPVHGPPSYHVPIQNGSSVDPEPGNAPDSTLKQFSVPARTSPVKIVHPSVSFPLTDPSFAGSSYGLAESTGSLPRHISLGSPPMMGLNQAPWARMDLDSSHTGSYGYSGTFHQQDSSSSSDCLSLQDPLIRENAHRFPPRMPTAPPFINRSSARKNIQSWIAAHNNSAIMELDPTDSLDKTSSEDASEAFSEASDQSYESSHVEFEEQWRLLNEKRNRVRDLRGIMAEKRKSLRTLRLKTTNADNAFMSAIRPLLVNRGALQNDTMTQLGNLMDTMQMLRTEYQDLETSYEEIEDEVGIEEPHLERIELRFFSQLGGAESEPSEDSSSNRGDSFVNDLPDELLGISHEKELEDLHPLFVQLTLAVASQHSAQEELAYLQNINHSINTYCEDEQWTFERSQGQKLAREMADFLDDFPILVKSKKEELNECRQEVDRLRGMCEERQAMAKHLPFQLDRALNPAVDPEDLTLPDKETILRERRTMAHPRYSEILSQPDHLLATPEPLTPSAAKEAAESLPDPDPGKLRRVRLATKEWDIDQLVPYTRDEDDKNGNINRWLLYNLRLSPLNASLLHSIFITTQGLFIRDLGQWQRDVLHHWWRDKIPQITNFAETSDRRSISRAVSEGANGMQPSHRPQRAHSTS